MHYQEALVIGIAHWNCFPKEKEACFMIFFFKCAPEILKAFKKTKLRKPEFRRAKALLLKDTYADLLEGL